MNCFDCPNAIFDYETYYGGGKQKIVIDCKIGKILEECENEEGDEE